jgi:hypothetical protein
MSKRNASFGKTIVRRSAKEARKVKKGVLHEGRKIVVGTIKGLVNVFNPFR